MNVGAVAAGSLRHVAMSRTARVLVGLVISAAFIYVTIARVDVAEVVRAVRAVAPLGLAVGFLLAWLEICVRALRWRYLLGPIRHVGFRPALSYLCIGYFANTLLPARLGDVARAHLAGTSFGISRLATLGTIVIERLADGLSIIAIAIALGLAVHADSPLVSTAVTLSIAVVAIAIVGGALLLAAHRTAVRGEVARIAASFTGRIAAGAASVRSPIGIGVVSAYTLVAFAFAAASLAVILLAVGISLPPSQIAFVMAGVALSTAIPAAPGSIGTYEFVGLTLLTSFGVPPEPALAAILLLHLCGLLPASIVGLIMTWVYHVRVSTLVEDDGESARD